MPDLDRLDALIMSRDAINGTLSLDDIGMLPLLRSVAVVEGLFRRAFTTISNL